MVEHVSAGIVPVRWADGHWEVFIVHDYSDHWLLPKGHQEPGETFVQTARRELHEETGLTAIDVHEEHAYREEYTFTWEGQPHHKVVTFFLGRVDDAQSTIQTTELQDGRWVKLEEAERHLTFAETKQVIRRARHCLQDERLWAMS